MSNILKKAVCTKQWTRNLYAWKEVIYCNFTVYLLILLYIPFIRSQIGKCIFVGMKFSTQVSSNYNTSITNHYAFIHYDFTSTSLLWLALPSSCEYAPSKRAYSWRRYLCTSYTGHDSCTTTIRWQYFLQQWKSENINYLYAVGLVLVLLSASFICYSGLVAQWVRSSFAKTLV